jgi:putative transposase
VNHERVERIWRREGLKVPARQRKRGRLWLNDGSCIRLRPERRHHVWAYDFVEDRTQYGKKLRMLTVVDEFSRTCLAISVERRLNSGNVLDPLADLFIEHGPQEHIRSDNGPEFIATAVREARSDRRRDTLHRTRQPMGERLQRVLQRQAARRAYERGKSSRR